MFDDDASADVGLNSNGGGGFMAEAQPPPPQTPSFLAQSAPPSLPFMPTPAADVPPAAPPASSEDSNASNASNASFMSELVSGKYVKQLALIIVLFFALNYTPVIEALASVFPSLFASGESSSVISKLFFNALVAGVVFVIINRFLIQ